MLGIPFYVWDSRSGSERPCWIDFLDEYGEGGTPDPCVSPTGTSSSQQFFAVPKRSDSTLWEPATTPAWWMARMGSSCTVRLTPARISRTCWVYSTPSSWRLRCSHWATVTSPDVREEAAARGLLVADKPDSHDICFIPDGDTRAFLRERLGGDSGPIVDEASGARVGTHPGAVGFTIGQRRGLNLRQPAPDGNPRYIVDVDVASNTVFVGPPARLRVRGFTVDRLRWTGRPDMLAPLVDQVQIRAHADPVTARFALTDASSGNVSLTEELAAVAAGQIAVFYQQDRVLGSGRIIATGR